MVIEDLESMDHDEFRREYLASGENDPLESADGTVYYDCSDERFLAVFEVEGEWWYQYLDPYGEYMEGGGHATAQDALDEVAPCW